MKKILTVCAALLALVMLFSLSACSSGGAKKSVAEIAKAIEDASGLVNALAIDDDEVYYSMGVTLENVEEYAGSHSNSSGASGTVFVAKAKSGQAEAIKGELEKYKNANAELLSGYTEFANSAEQAKNGRIMVKDDIVILVIGGPDADYAAIDTAVESALQ